MLSKRFNSLWLGLLIGLSVPVLFSWVYLKRFYPLPISFFNIIRQLYPSVMLGKLLLLSIIPNLIGVFIFYKQDTFKIGIGVMLGVIPYLFLALYML